MKKSLNGLVFKALKLGEMSNKRIPMLLMSGPGAGKTTSVECFARARGYELVILRGNSTSAEEVLGYGVAPSDLTSENIETAKNQTLVRLRPRWYQRILNNHEKGKKTLLFLDEITTAPVQVQSALLHLVFEKAVDEELLPEDTLVVAAGNYAQNLGSEMNLLPPLMNRFCIINLTFSLDDLDLFLNEYEGSLQNENGMPTGKDKKMANLMKELDDIEKGCKISDAFRNRAGEYFERVIKETTKQAVSKLKLADLNARDLSGLFSDMTESFTGLLGFITPRTLTYLVDAAVTSYSIFGKDGIQSEDFKNVIDGLCGVGIVSQKDGNTKVNYIGELFYTALSSIVNDIEKMKNNAIKDYENYLKSHIKAEYLKDSKFKFDVPTLVALRNKFTEISGNGEISQIERPISEDLIDSLIQLLSKSQKNSKPNREPLGTVPEINKLAAEITYFNEVSRLVGVLHEFVSDARRGYKDNSINAINNAKKENGGIAVMFKGLKAMAVTGKADGLLIPDIVKAGCEKK